MSLLKYMRSDYGLTRSQIVSIIVNKTCSNDWSASKITNFTNGLSDFGNKASELGSDIISNEEIYSCNDCGSAEFMDDMRSCYQGDFYVCEGCCDDSYSYSENQDTYINYDDYDEESRENYQEESGVYDYGHRVEDDLGKLCMPNQKSTSENMQIYYGIELEVEKRTNCPNDLPYYITDNVLCGFLIGHT